MLTSYYELCHYQGLYFASSKAASSTRHAWPIPQELKTLHMPRPGVARMHVDSQPSGYDGLYISTPPPLPPNASHKLNTQGEGSKR